MLRRVNVFWCFDLMQYKSLYLSEGRRHDAGKLSGIWTVVLETVAAYPFLVSVSRQFPVLLLGGLVQLSRLNISTPHYPTSSSVFVCRFHSQRVSFSWFGECFHCQFSHFFRGLLLGFFLFVFLSGCILLAFNTNAFSLADFFKKSI